MKGAPCDLKPGTWYSVHFVIAAILERYIVTRGRDSQTVGLATALVQWGAVTPHPRDPETVQVVEDFWERCITEMGIADAIARLG